jgi:hypothetical protein
MPQISLLAEMIHLKHTLEGEINMILKWQHSELIHLKHTLESERNLILKWQHSELC